MTKTIFPPLISEAWQSKNSEIIVVKKKLCKTGKLKPTLQHHLNHFEYRYLLKVILANIKAHVAMSRVKLLSSRFVCAVGMNTKPVCA